MNEDAINMEIRKLLKKVGITSQREIEKALNAGFASGKLSGGEKLEVNVRLEIPEIGLVHSLQETISVE
jgi:hypothetical protein